MRIWKTPTRSRPARSAAPSRLRRRSIAVGLTAALVAGSAALSLAPGAHAAGPAWMDTSLSASARADRLLAAMSFDDKINMLHNQNGCAYAGCTPSSFSGGTLPALHLQDGPVGVGDGVNGVTLLPAPVAAAATWDTDLVRQYGAVLGQEHWGKGVNVVLGPTVNIVRDPRWGRAFESFGEDPYLTGQIAAADINGIQAQGPLAQIKHYAAYNQETNRNSPADNVIVSERALREIYTPAFETAIKQSNVASVMCAYSVINGQFACENQHTQNEILKRDMGFNGFITADWGAVHSTVASANNGLDMEMPDTNRYFGDALKTAVNNGQVSIATINDKVHRILTKMFEFGLFDKSQPGNKDSAVRSSAHDQMAKTVAAAGHVLLKNTNNVLPFTSATRSIAVIGDEAGSRSLFQGGGSANVNPPYQVAPIDGIRARAGSATVSFTGNDSNAAATAARAADVAVVFVGKWESEGSDLGDISLGSQNDLVTAVAAANPNTIVVVHSASAVTMPWANNPNVKAIFEGWYPGQENGNATAALLFGDINPSGKLPVSFPVNQSDLPTNSQAQFPGTNNQVQYSEGLNVGYRSYDARNIAPLFPFGFGLSYTTFGYSGINVGAMDASGNVAVSFTVTNTGNRTGAEVPQVYVGLPAGSGEPPKTLQGFKKVSLGAGASMTVSLSLPVRAFQFWGANGWTTPSGSATISVGSSSRDIKLTGSVSLTPGSTGTPTPTPTVTTPTPTPSTGAPRDAFSTIQAESYDAQSGTQTENTTDVGGGQNVGYIGNGDYLRYDNVAFGIAGTNGFIGEIASGAAGTAAGSIEVHLDSLTGPTVSTLPVDGTGGWQNWAGVSAGMTSVTGTHTVFLKFVTSGAGDFVNINWFKFGQSVVVQPPAETPLSRAGWVASASATAGGDVPANAIDANAGSRWSTGTPMANGQTFTLDLGSAKSFNQVIVDSGSSANDYARGLTVQVSQDGSNWANVVQATSSGTVKQTVTFQSTTARYVRLVQTGANPSWWSISDLSVLSGTINPVSDPIIYPRTGWVATTNTTCGDGPVNVLDGNNSTRFSTCAAMTNGQWLQVDMGRSLQVGTVFMNSGGSASDYARGYTVSLSTDGVNFTPVASGTGTNANISAHIPPQNARYIRVTQTGSATNWWSVAELSVQNI